MLSLFILGIVAVVGDAMAEAWTPTDLDYPNEVQENNVAIVCRQQPRFWHEKSLDNDHFLIMLGVVVFCPKDLTIWLFGLG